MRVSAIFDTNYLVEAYGKPNAQEFDKLHWSIEDIGLSVNKPGLSTVNLLYQPINLVYRAIWQIGVDKHGLSKIWLITGKKPGLSTPNVEKVDKPALTVANFFISR